MPSGPCYWSNGSCPSVSSLGESTAGDRVWTAQLRPKALSPRNHKGLLNARVSGNWRQGSLGIRTLESAAGSQGFIGIEPLYRKKGHRESGSQGCSNDRVPSEVLLCKDPPGAASAATTHSAGTNGHTESTEPCHPIPMAVSVSPSVPTQSNGHWYRMGCCFEKCRKNPFLLTFCYLPGFTAQWKLTIANMFKIFRIGSIERVLKVWPFCGIDRLTLVGCGCILKLCRWRS